MRTALTGRTHGCTDQPLLREDSPCQLGAVHAWQAAYLGCPRYVDIEGKPDGHGQPNSVENDPSETSAGRPTPVPELISGPSSVLVIYACAQRENLVAIAMPPLMQPIISVSNLSKTYASGF